MLWNVILVTLNKEIILAKDDVWSEVYNQIITGQYDINNWSSLPVDLTSYPPVIDVLLSHNPEYYLALPDQYKLDYQYCLGYLKATNMHSGYGDYFENIPAPLQNEHFFLYYVEHVHIQSRLRNFFRYVYQYYNEQQQPIPLSIILSGISQKFPVLGYASQDIQNTYMIALECVQNNYQDCSFVSESLRNNPHFLYDAIINHHEKPANMFVKFFGSEFKKLSGLHESSSSEEICDYLIQYHDRKLLSQCLEKDLEKTLLPQQHHYKHKI